MLAEGSGGANHGDGGCGSHDEGVSRLAETELPDSCTWDMNKLCTPALDGRSK